MIDETKLFYNITAESTADEWYSNDVLMPNIHEFISLLPSNPRVLDLGCGPGYESMRLSLTGAEVFGIDYSEECIRVARERCAHCKFEVYDFRYLDNKLGKFDGVFACASLIHVKEEELSIVFEQITKVLKPNGYLMVMLRDGRGVIKRPYKNKDKDLVRLVYLHSKEDFMAIALKFGFKFIKESQMDESFNEHNWRCYILKYDNKV